MKKAGDLLRMYIERSGYTIYGIAKNSGVNRSTLQKVLLENRKPSKHFIRQLMPFLKLSTEEMIELLSVIELMHTGEALYHQRLYIKNMVERFSAISNQNYEEGVPPVPMVTDGQAFQESFFLHGESATESFICRLIKHECQKETSQIRIHIPGSANILHSILTYIRYHCPDYQKLSIQHLTYFTKSRSSDKPGTGNLEILNHLLPLIAAMPSTYQVFYCYHDTCLLPQGTPIAFPYYITGSGWNILLSGDYSTAMFCNAPDASIYLNELFDSELPHARPLTAMCSGPGDALSMFRQPENPPEGYASFTCQPQMGSHPACISVFSRDGLISFTETGQSTDFPLSCISPVSIEERISLLWKLHQDTEQQTSLYVMVNPSFFDVTYGFSFYVAENRVLVFAMDPACKNGGSWIITVEQTLIDAFYDFVNYLTESFYVYETKETLDFIQQCIRSLQCPGP